MLDPFKGTGTTLRVAHARGRNAVGVDLAPKTDIDVWGPISKRQQQGSLSKNGSLSILK